MSPETNTEWMEIHVATLFDLDAHGRIRSLRRPWTRSGGAPRFFMGRTPEGHVWRFRHDLPGERVRELEDLCRSEPRAEDLRRPPSIAPAIRAALQASGPTVREYRGPAFWIPEAARAAARAVRVTKAKAHLLDARFPWMKRPLESGADIGPVTAVVVDGEAVSLCYCARLSPEAAEAGVETLEAMRGRGFASAAVAAWAAAVRERGLRPLYSTAWENLASQGVARRLGMAAYGEDWEIE